MPIDPTAARRTGPITHRCGAAALVAAIGWLALSPAVGLRMDPTTTRGARLDAQTIAAASPQASPPASAAASPLPTTTPSPEPTASPGATACLAPPLPASPSPGPSSPIPTGSPSLPTGVAQLGPSSATPLMRAALDRHLDRLRVKLGIPGLSASILFADGTIWTGASGLADVATGRSVDADTPFAAASVSKTFTAALILALVDEGRLALDTPVRTYLPDLAIDRRITIRQLLDHTSGLRDYFFGKRIDAALLSQPGRTWHTADTLRYVGKPYFRPGAGFHYSNTNYFVLGLVAEAVGGAPVAAQLRTRFFEPLRLLDTTYQGAEPPAAPPAHGYRFTGSSTKLPAIDLSDGTAIVPFTSVITAAGAAGSIATSPRDLVRWAQALYGGHLLSAASYRQMIGDVARTARFKPSVPYGLGVQATVIDGRPTLGHSGRLLGSRAVVRWLTADAIGIAVMTNQSRTDPAIVARVLLKIALVQPTDFVQPSDYGACPGG